MFKLPIFKQFNASGEAILVTVIFSLFSEVKYYFVKQIQPCKIIN